MSDSQSLSIFEDQGLSAEQAQFCTLVASGKTFEEARALVGVTEYRTAKWQAELPAFEQALRRARAIIVEARVDRMADVARNEPDVNRARLIIDTDKWLASKLVSKVYGDKLDVSIDHRIDISDALAAARSRATLRPRCDPVDAIDAEFEALPSVATPGSVDKQSTQPALTLPDIFD
jgi:phosphoenolpyruvate-protein kinase (PTS system EI component)